MILCGALALAAAAGWAWLRPAAPPPKDGAEVVASVSTVAARSATLPLIMTVFGEISPGREQSISFPRAGQVQRLPVLPGQRVAKGEPLATLVSDPMAEAAYRQALAALTLAEGEAQRTGELFALQLATAGQVQTASKAVADARANAEAQRKLGGDVASAVVAAPFDGVVVAVNVAQGERVQPGTALVRLGRIDSLRVVLGIEPAERMRVHPGDAVTLSPLQAPATTAQGSIGELQDLINPKTQLIDAVVTLPARAAVDFVPGMRVRAEIRTGEQAGWVVPRLAVLNDAAGAYLYQVRQGKARRVAVRVLAEQDQSLSVNGPLDAALPVVSRGNYELADGMKIRLGAAEPAR
ncbi:efflux RND transporter periplasmic adaptor subunit [Cupriavidus sp. CuC1]|uniref:efflux RND transporter periplasmic adaptor subunit n=1 Tax=Cupriavidus sp. CuC1 TaxID=3373131 RepID=UPI0037D95674